MDSKTIIEQLEGLREHCSSMIQKDEPDSIWKKDRDALDGAIYAIEALQRLNINNSNGGINRMSNEGKVTVTVTIEMPDGIKKELTGDTVICFTVEQAKEFMDGRARILQAQAVSIGKEIPAPIFAPTIGALVGDYLEKSPNSGGKVMAAYNLHTVAELLGKKSKEIGRQASPQEVESALEDALKNLFEALRR